MCVGAGLDGYETAPRRRRPAGGCWRGIAAVYSQRLQWQAGQTWQPSAKWVGA